MLEVEFWASRGVTKLDKEQFGATIKIWAASIITVTHLHTMREISVANKCPGIRKDNAVQPVSGEGVINLAL